MTLVVNMFAAPGSGKSTTAAGLFHKLKCTAGITAELVTEFAKDITWAERNKALEDQFYIFGKQHHRLHILKDKVDVIVTDSPLLLGVVYSFNYPQSFISTIYWAFNSFNNINFLLNRTKEYKQVGRNQTEEESDKLQEIIRNSLNILDVPYYTTTGDKDGLEFIYEKVVNQLL